MCVCDTATHNDLVFLIIRALLQESTSTLPDTCWVAMPSGSWDGELKRALHTGSSLTPGTLTGAIAVILVVVYTTSDYYNNVVVQQCFDHTQSRVRNSYRMIVYCTHSLMKTLFIMQDSSRSFVERTRLESKPESTAVFQRTEHGQLCCLAQCT